MQKAVWEHISQESGEEIYTWKTCIYSGENFPVFEKEKKLLDELGLPLPETSADERLRNMYMMRNERTLYKRNCDLTGISMLSVYPPEFEGKVYNFKDYISPKWSGFDYGIDVDLNGDIKQQIGHFFVQMPHRSLNINAEKGMENCDYSNYGFGSKDCYMCQVPAAAEKCYYSYLPFQSKYNVDTYLNEQCEISYESMLCINSYNTFYCQYVEDSRDCWFGYDLVGCKNCLGCVGLNGKQYFILNESVTQKEYEEKLLAIGGDYEVFLEFQKSYEQLKESTAQQPLRNKLSENAFGNTVRYSANALNSYGVVDAKDVLNSHYVGLKSNNLLSCTTGGTGSSHLYHCVGFSESTKSAYISFGSGSRSYYLYDTANCSDCMFCIGLQNQQYCIFNKQYSKEKYEELSSQLIDTLKKQGIWGTNFPIEMMLFPYNDSKAYYEFPIEKVVYLNPDKSILRVENIDVDGTGTVYVLEPEAFISKAYIDMGGTQNIDITWRTQENNIDIPQDTPVLSAGQIPHISEIDDTILEKIILCKDTGKPFRIIAQELEFYKKYSLPIPRKHPDTRFKNRFKKLPGNTLYLRPCSQSGVETLTCWKDQDIVCEQYYSNNLD